MIYFFGARIDPLPRDVIVQKLVDFVNGNKTRIISTPNPEMLLYSEKNKKLKSILSNVDLGIVDGAGLKWTMQAKGFYVGCRFPGVDIVDELAKLCSQYGKRLMLIGGDLGVAGEAKMTLIKRYPNIKIASYIGPNISYKLARIHPYAQTNQEVIREIQSFEPDVVLVALGHGKQEEWIADHAKSIKGVKIWCGVGGSFDMISGKRDRAPLLMRKIGLEWLWRLIWEPKRLPRIFKAVVVFPIKSISKTVIHNYH